MSRVFTWNNETEPADGTISAGTVGMWLNTSDGFVKYKTSANVVRILGQAGVITSVFGRTGAVVAALDDYLTSLIKNDSGVGGDQLSDALDILASAITARLLLSGGTMTGDIDMDSNNIINAIVNGVTLTNAGDAGNFLNEVGNYVPPASAALDNYYQAVYTVGTVVNPNNVIPQSVIFDSTEKSQSWITDTSDTQKTINEAGEYNISYAVLVAKPVGAPVTLEFDLFVNGIQSLEYSDPAPMDGDNFHVYESVSRVKLDLIANDVLEIKGFHLQGNTGQTLVVQNTTRLTIFKVN